MNAKKKTVLKSFDYMHCDDFAKFLSEMAAKGWHFKEWGLGLKFEKGEPESVTYAVEVFTDASEYDLRPEPHTKAFAEYCEAAGWQLVDAKQKYTIFKKVQEDAIPILTPEERVQNAYKERRRELIPALITSIMFLTMQLFNTFGKYYFAERIFSPLQLSLLIIWATAFIERSAKLIGLLWCKHKMKQKLAAGENVYLGNDSGKMKIFSKSGFWISLVVELMCIAMIPEKWLWQIVAFFIGVVLSILIFAMILAKLRPESNTNFIVQSVFSMFYVVTVLAVAVCFIEIERQDRIQTDAPLMKEDYMEYDVALEKITAFNDQNILGKKQTYFISYEGTDGINYDVYSSDIDWIMDKIWAMETEMWGRGERVDCADKWDATVAFYDEHNEYFVRYDNMILIFDDYDERVLTQDQINIIRDKLDLR